MLITMKFMHDDILTEFMVLYARYMFLAFFLSFFLSFFLYSFLF